MLTFYPDKADLSEILRPTTQTGEEIGCALESAELALCISPVHLWEMSNSPTEHAKFELECLRRLRSPGVALPSPTRIVTSVVRETAQLPEHTIRVEAGKIGDLVDSMLDWAEDRDTWNTFAMTDRALRRAAQKSLIPKEFGIPSLAERLRAVITALKKPDATAMERWEADAVGLWDGTTDVPRSLHAKQSELIAGTSRMVRHYGSSRKKRVQAALANLLPDPFLNSLAMNADEMAIFLLAPAEIVRASVRARTSPKRLVRAAIEAPSPLRIVVETGEQRRRDKTRRVQLGDFADLVHLMYAPLVDCLTCDKSHRNSLLSAARRSQSAWLSEASERVLKTGGEGMRDVLAAVRNSA